jgi:hypothetical protein
VPPLISGEDLPAFRDGLPDYLRLQLPLLPPALPAYGAEARRLAALAGLLLAGLCAPSCRRPRGGDGLRPPAQGRRFMAVTANPHATAAALEMLRAGARRWMRRSPPRWSSASSSPSPRASVVAG